MRSRKIFMTDFTSAEWAPHYDIQGATHGGHPAWLAPVKMVEHAWENLSSQSHAGENIYDDPDDANRKRIGIIAEDLGGCIAGALMQVPTIIVPNIGTMGFKQNAIGNHPLVRFAQRFGVMKEVVIEKGQLGERIKALRNGETAMPSPQLVEAAKIEAYATMERMLPQPEPAADADQVTAALSIFGGAQERVVGPHGEPTDPSSTPRTSGMPKVISPGDPFDPATHYGEYYYGDGPGMIYTNPAGEKVRYPGPGRDWEGFDTVADIFRMIFNFGEGPTVVSLGCGFGSDVLRFCKRGWDAWGCDISEWSVNQAPVAIRDKIVLGNICHQNVQKMLPENPNLVCTFDFWEHIFLEDVDTLLADLGRWMKPGSFMANIICTTGRNEKDITIRPEDGFTLQNSWFLISGHVTGRRWHWWANKFHEHGFLARLDLSYLFQVARNEDAALSQSMSWRPRNLLIVERPKD
jgi:hypothetical protein